MTDVRFSQSASSSLNSHVLLDWSTEFGYNCEVNTHPADLSAWVSAPPQNQFQGGCGGLASVFDLHVHTNQGSADSALTPEEMVTEATRLGLTGIMITEHTGWARPEFEEFAKDQELVLVNSLEMYTPLGHIITLGLDKYVTGYNGDIETIRTLRREVDRVGGVMVLAHPFRHLLESRGNYTQNILFERWDEVPTTPEVAATHPIFDLLDEIEVVNGGNLENENRLAQSVAELLGFQGTGGSDAHSINGLGKGATVFPGDIRNQADLLEALKSGEFFPIEGFHLGKPVDYGNASENGPLATRRIP